MTFLSRSDETAPAFPLGLLFFVCLVLAWSWIGAADRMTWWLEAFPALIALPVLAITYKRFQFTRLAFVLIALHACILLVGAHYTYERVTLFNLIRDHFHLHRNDYDKLGHRRKDLSRRRINISRAMIDAWWQPGGACISDHVRLHGD